MELGPGIGAIGGGGAGFLGGIMQRGDQRRQQEMALSQLQIPRMLEVQKALYPQAMGFMQGGFQDLMASLLGGTQAAGGNAMNLFNSILGQNNMLGGGYQAGGNAGLQLQTGQNMGQARGYGANLLAGMENQSMQGVLQRALGYGDTTANNPVNMNPFIGAMQGMGMGANMFEPKNQGQQYA